MSKEAMKLALEALEYPGNVWHMDCPRNAAITAIKEALADQCVCGEPDTPGTHRTDGPCLAEQPAQRQEPVISTAHGPWIPSTHPGEEGESYCKRCLLRDKFLGSRQCDPHIVPPEQPAQQEPVARSKAYDMIDRFLQNNLNSDEDYAEYSKALDSIYTSPPASKPWVGLTDQEIRDWWRIENGLEDCQLSKLVDFTLAVRAIEAKLKEKNA